MADWHVGICWRQRSFFTKHSPQGSGSSLGLVSFIVRGMTLPQSLPVFRNMSSRHDLWSRVFFLCYHFVSAFASSGGRVRIGVGSGWGGNACSEEAAQCIGWAFGLSISGGSGLHFAYGMAVPQHSSHFIVFFLQVVLGVGERGFNVFSFITWWRHWAVLRF